VLQRVDLVRRRREAHHAGPVQVALGVDVPLRQLERHLGDERRHARASPSCASTSVSMAMSLPLALSAGPSHFVAHARKNFHRATSVLLARSNTPMEPFLRTTMPSAICWRQSHSSVEEVSPHFSEMSAYVVLPGSLRTVRLSPPS